MFYYYSTHQSFFFGQPQVASIHSLGGKRRSDYALKPIPLGEARMGRVVSMFLLDNFKPLLTLTVDSLNLS
jgi:hypothetical protein